MERTKFNFAAVLSLMVLFIYSYIMFLGLVYWQNGDILLPLGLTVVFMAVVVGCLFAMCASKATRWHRIGIIGQVLFGLIILAAFTISTLPFTNFMHVVERQVIIGQEISITLDTAKSLDESYTNYANKRINSYKERLEFVSKGKRIRPSEYNECMGRASGKEDEEKIEGLAKSLRMKLLPDTIKVIQTRRQEWLQSASNMNVWNVKLPANLMKISEEVDKWTDNYMKLSSIAYKGEESEVFSYEQFNSKISGLTSFYTELHKPTFMALMLALLGFAVILLPFIMTEDSLERAASKGTKNSNIYE